MPSIRRRSLFVAAALGFVGLLTWAVAAWLSTGFDLPGLRAAAHGVVFVDKHDVVAVACADKHLYLYSLQGGELLHRIGGHDKRLTSISSFPGADVVATASADGLVRIWEMPRGVEVHAIAAHDGIVLAVRFSHDGKVLATVGDDNKLRLWDPETGQSIGAMDCKNPNGCLAVSPNGRLVALSGPGPTLLVRDVETGGVKKSFSGDSSPTAACFSPDGGRLAVGWADGKVEIRDSGSWRRSAGATGHGQAVTGVEYSPDGRTLVTSSADRLVGIWDADGGYLKGHLRGHPRGVLCVAAAPTGVIASGGYGKYARVWTRPAAALQ